MRPSSFEQDGEIRNHSIHIGGVFVSQEPAAVRTILGSCISVCLRDPRTFIGGLNHFMLPEGASKCHSPTSFGVHAMELLINGLMHLGADRRRFEAKVFGGGHVLQTSVSDKNVPARNILFATEFLETEGIPIITKDVGGYAAREIYFYTYSGRVALRRLAPTGLDPRTLEEIARVPARVETHKQSDDDILF